MQSFVDCRSWKNLYSKVSHQVNRGNYIATVQDK